jgi:hypothetical protein
MATDEPAATGDQDLSKLVHVMPSKLPINQFSRPGQGRHAAE